MKVVVTGGRDFNEKKFIEATLNKIHEETPITLLVNGNAVGADILSGIWSVKNEINTLTVPAKWNTLGNKSAGPLRNREMADMFDYDVVIAFPGGHGTADMIQYCESIGLKVVKFEMPPRTKKRMKKD